MQASEAPASSPGIAPGGVWYARVPDRRGPYLGLRPVDQDDRAYFFGRQLDQEIIKSNLIAAKLTILYSASGVGKTSVLRAAVAPMLREALGAAVLVFREWQGSNCLEILKQALLDETSHAAGRTLNLDPGQPLETLLVACQDALRAPIFLIFDQFEEYALYHPPSDDPTSYDTEIARAINDPAVDAHFTIALREDGLSTLDRFDGRIADLLTNLLRLEYLDREGGRQAIKDPLGVYNASLPPHEQPVTIDDDLVEALLDQTVPGRALAGDRPSGSTPGPVRDHLTHRVETPFLQIVLVRLWQQMQDKQSHTLSLHLLQQLGDASSVVRAHIDRIMEARVGSEREIAARAFRQLVTPSGAKIALTVTDLAYHLGRERDKVEADAVEAVLKSLAGGEEPILRAIPAPAGAAADARYEIAHDALAPAILAWCQRYEQERARQEGEQQQRQQQRQRRFVSAVVGAFVVLLAAVGLTSFSWLQSQYQLERTASEQATVVAVADARSAASVATAGAISQATAQSADEAQARSAAAATVAAAAQQTSQPLATQAVQAQATSQAYATAAAVAQATTQVLQAQAQQAQAAAEVQQQAAAGAIETANLANDKLPYLVAVLRGHTGRVTTADFDRSGRFVASAGQDGSIRLWESPTGAAVQVWDLPGGAKRSLRFSREGSFLAAVGDTLVLADLRRAPLPDASWETLAGTTGPLNAVAFGPDEHYLAAGGENGAAWMWELSGGLRRLIPLDGHTTPITSIDVTEERDQAPFVLTTTQGGSAGIWDIDGDRRVRVMSSGGGFHNGVFSPDGYRVLTATSQTATAPPVAMLWNINRVWGLPGPDPATAWETLAGHTDSVRQASFSHSGEQILTVSADRTAIVWRTSPLGQVHVLRGHEGIIRAGAFSPNDDRVVTASADATARVWSTATGSLIAVLRGHVGPLASAAFSADGRYVVTASEDGTVRIWEPGGPGTGP